MPVAYLVLCGASVLVPLVLFGVAIWTGIKRQLALAALERHVRERIEQRRRRAWLITAGAPPVVPTRRGSRTAA